MKYIFVVVLLATLAISALQAVKVDDGDQQEQEGVGEGPISSLRGIGRFLAAKPIRELGTMTCNKYPRVCRSKGSPGPDCCKKKCVNVLWDRVNCGKCGGKCKYTQICCKGKCVNTMADKNNCGSCNNKCKTGNKCIYGLCSYA